MPNEGEVNRQGAKGCWASQTGLHDAMHTWKLPLSVRQNPSKGQGRKGVCGPQTDGEADAVPCNSLMTMLVVETAVHV